jgi:hypothetical protein
MRTEVSVPNHNDIENLAKLRQMTAAEVQTDCEDSMTMLRLSAELRYIAQADLVRLS